jgi:hypothetical protein
MTKQVGWGQVNALEVMPVFLLLLFSVALVVGTGIVLVVIRRSRATRIGEPQNPAPPRSAREEVLFVPRPVCWLAVRSKNLAAVQKALGLNNPKPCSLMRGFAGEERLFLAQPVKGWILVAGSDLPDPCHDPDVSYRFIVGLSRKLGQVQLFCANRMLHHHAWVQADRGTVVRAYAWAGQTVWNEGKRTAPEKDLDLKCLDYAETVEHPGFGVPDCLAINAEKVPQLAARWSLDPIQVEEAGVGCERGVAGEPSHYY